MTVLIAQFSMIIMAVIALKVINKKGAVTIITLTALTALPVRALTAGYFHSPEIMVIIQILDGVGAGFMVFAALFVFIFSYKFVKGFAIK